jgi:hemerythrin-like domain-containing protein
MLPIAPLMIEHRLIEKMIALMKMETDRLTVEGVINFDLIDLVVDFIRTYADQCHHGKEEKIFFRELGRKSLSREHTRLMEELMDEHRQGREATADLVRAKERYVKGVKDELYVIIGRMKFIHDFYPKHIEKEDKHFFLPCMDYFTAEEKDNILREEWEFDKGFIHQVYEGKVRQAETLMPPG